MNPCLSIGRIVKQYIVTDIIDLYGVLEIQCLESFEVFYIRSENLAGHYKKDDIIQIKY